MSRSFMVALTGVVFVASLAARQPAPTTLVAASLDSQSEYVGADSCKSCHDAVYQAWSKTKHAQALRKLGAADRAGGKCIGCHVTGYPEVIAAEGATPSHPNVQCEACHGPGKKHVDAAQAGDASDARTIKIEEQTCTRCHNETSPHYKPFFYQAMVGLVHR